MGGKEGLRGYIYQAVSAILEALTENTWDEISVEFPTSGDKVDIALLRNQHIIKAIQVKSSINQFNKTSVNKWIYELISDTSAQEYQICLIGECAKNTTEFINSIEKYKSKKMDKVSSEVLEGFATQILDKHTITIKTLPFNQKILESMVRDAISCYISKKGYTLPYDAIELIANSAINLQNMLATQGASISKKEFDSKIYGWISMLSGSKLKQIKGYSKHKLMFYDQKNTDFSVEINKKKLVSFYGVQRYFDKIENKCRQLIDEITQIDLPTYEKPTLNVNTEKNIEVKNSNRGIGLSILKDIKFDFSGDKYAEYSNQDKKEIIDEIKDLFGISVKASFFYVGELKESTSYGFLGDKYIEYKGNDIEKRKMDLIRDLNLQMLYLDYAKKFLEPINNWMILPIVIQNISDVNDQSITIKVYISKSDAQLACSRDYVQTELVQDFFEIFCDDKGIIKEMFRLSSDIKVIFEQSAIPKIPINYIYSNYKYDISDVYIELNEFWATNGYDDKVNYVLEFEIQNLKPGEVKWLGKLILLQELTNDINIHYEILSHNTDGTNCGNILIKNDILMN